MTSGGRAATVLAQFAQAAYVLRNSSPIGTAFTWTDVSTLLRPSLDSVRSEIKDLVDKFLYEWLKAKPAWVADESGGIRFVILRHRPAGLLAFQPFPASRLEGAPEPATCRRAPPRRLRSIGRQSVSPTLEALGVLLPSARISRALTLSVW